MIIQTQNAIKSYVKINCMSNKHNALKKLKLKAIEINKYQEGYKNQDTHIVLKINWNLNQSNLKF